MYPPESPPAPLRAVARIVTSIVSFRGAVGFTKIATLMFPVESGGRFRDDIWVAPEASQKLMTTLSDTSNPFDRRLTLAALKSSESVALPALVTDTSCHAVSGGGITKGSGDRRVVANLVSLPAGLVTVATMSPVTSATLAAPPSPPTAMTDPAKAPAARTSEGQTSPRLAIYNMERRRRDMP